MCTESQISLFSMIHTLKEVCLFLSPKRKKTISFPLYLIIAFIPLICVAEDGDNIVRKRSKKRKNVGTERHWPHYEGCQDMPEQPFPAEEFSSSERDTEATARCGFHCQRFLSSFGLFKEAAHSVREADFKGKLKKRVIFQIESKIVEIRLLKACITEDKDYLLSLFKDEDWLAIKKACRKKTGELKSSIEKLWPDMAIHLSLSSPAMLEERIISSPSTWLDPSPSHKISGFSDMPKLRQSELKKAKEIYIETLVKAYEENHKFSTYSLTPEEFKNHLQEGKPLHTGRKQLAEEAKGHLRKAIRDLREKNRQRYFEVISEMPLLGYRSREHQREGGWLKPFQRLKKI